MSITVQTAVVYKSSNGKRYFTKRAALMAEALMKLKKKYDAEGEDSEGRPYFDMDQMDHFSKVSKRYYRRFKSTVKAAPEIGQ